MSPIAAVPAEIPPAHRKAWTDRQNSKLTRDADAPIPKLPMHKTGILHNYIGQCPSSEGSDSLKVCNSHWKTYKVRNTLPIPSPRSHSKRLQTYSKAEDIRFQPASAYYKILEYTFTTITVESRSWAIWGIEANKVKQRRSQSRILEREDQLSHIAYQFHTHWEAALQMKLRRQ